MSSVFEAGISLACIVIIHNWFKEEVLGTISALWMASYFLQVIFENSIFDSQMPAQDVDPERDIIATTLEIESYSLFGCYLVAAIVVWFVYYHHPSHIGIMIRDS